MSEAIIPDKVRRFFDSPELLLRVVNDSDALFERKYYFAASIFESGGVVSSDFLVVSGDLTTPDRTSLNVGFRPAESFKKSMAE